MKLKTSELDGIALDWAVAKCEGQEVVFEDGELCLPSDYFKDGDPYTPSTDWSQGGPIIEREAISVAADTAGVFDPFVWFASVDDILVDADEAIGVRGSTPLIAAMRCYVASHFGDEIEVPNELLQGEIA